VAYATGVDLSPPRSSPLTATSALHAGNWPATIPESSAAYKTRQTRNEVNADWTRALDAEPANIDLIKGTTPASLAQPGSKLQFV